MLRPSLNPSKERDLPCLLAGKHTYQLSPNCRLQPSPQTIMASHASVLS